jgi:serine/threonine-protein kinase ULK/ATG1
MTKKQVGKY